MVLKVKEIKRIKYKILNRKITEFSGPEDYIQYSFTQQRFFLSVFCAPGIVLGLEVSMVNTADKDLTFEGLAF